MEQGQAPKSRGSGSRKDTRTNRGSKIIRVNKDVLSDLEGLRRVHGSWNKALKHFLDMANAKVMWALPSDIFNTRAQAKGEALKRSVKSRSEEAETPVKVRPVNEA